MSKDGRSACSAERQARGGERRCGRRCRRQSEEGRKWGDVFTFSQGVSCLEAVERRRRGMYKDEGGFRKRREGLTSRSASVRPILTLLSTLWITNDGAGAPLLTVLPHQCPLDLIPILRWSDL
jgi:hypothetical protein